ncbi:MAG TPA: GNAT family N-acyltransferase [Gammaproteobacteria bacterium]|nr:GNAT family N-acyltransferase [Gammaproteobacteria bacterium]
MTSAEIRGHFSTRHIFSNHRLSNHPDFLYRSLDRLCRLDHLDRLYQQLPPGLEGEAFLRQALELLDIRPRILSGRIDDIPAGGPVIVVANHPFGGPEALLLAQMLLKIRPDVRMMANYLLRQITEIRDYLIDVDPFGGGTSARRNAAPLRRCLRWLQAGGLLLTFPSGTVSHLQWRSGKIIDPPWDPSIGRLVQLSQASVVPVYIHGHNRLHFQLLGLLHPLLRTALLPREFAARTGRRIELRIGAPIAYAGMKRLPDKTTLIEHLRLRTELLGQMSQTASSGAAVEPPLPRRAIPLILAPAPSLLKAEMDALPEEQILIRNKEWRVACAPARQIPWLLQEIGRLRELTFRSVGEGTGKPADIDLYDAYYQHLIVWNEASGQVAGGYRLGVVADILRHYGVRGLYTHSLFEFKRPLLGQLATAVELGRSFVRPEFQKSFAPLFLLWRGIGEFIIRRPQCHRLFGPVSISNDYHWLSRLLIVKHLHTRHYERELSRWVRPRRPFKPLRMGPWREAIISPGLDDLDVIADMVRGIETDGKEPPILLRQYLKLGGQLLGFNVDPEFGNTLDGLILVDLRRTDARLLERYMGQRGARDFLAFHRSRPAATTRQAA